MADSWVWAVLAIVAIVVMWSSNPIRDSLLSHTPRLVGNSKGPAGSFYGYYY
jgi:hypothetical protein